MRIPKKIRVGKTTWKIEFNPWIEYADGAMGITLFNEKKIMLSPLRDKNELEDTLLHEILHACFPGGIVSANTEEKIVGKLTGKLLTALKTGQIIRKEKPKMPSKRRRSYNKK